MRHAQASVIPYRQAAPPEQCFGVSAVRPLRPAAPASGKVLHL